IRVSDFKNGSIDINNLKYLDKEIFDQIKKYTISSEDIYISIAGTIGITGTVPNELNNKSLTENAAKIVLKSKNNTHQSFICLMLNSENIKEQIKNRTNALGVPKLAIKRIETIEIPLPTLKEQSLIVSKIEKIENQITELETVIQSIPKEKELVLKKYLE
ncbi:MAG: restriction endonuclease subunit S, partial [Bacteroidales bacterium]|nr:restriction endonuclease subunit S [Bacteroidales bacterium]